MSKMTRPSPEMVAPPKGPTLSSTPPTLLMTTSSLPTSSSTATARGRTPERNTSTGSRAGVAPPGSASTRSRRSSSISSPSIMTHSRSSVARIS